MTEPSKEARDAAEKICDVFMIARCNSPYEIIQSALDAAVAPYKDALRDLDLYADHADTCNARRVMFDKCSCGYDDMAAKINKLLEE